MCSKYSAIFLLKFAFNDIVLEEIISCLIRLVLNNILLTRGHAITRLKGRRDSRSVWILMIRLFSLLLISNLSFLRLNHVGALMSNAWRKGSSNPVMFRFTDNLRLESPSRKLQLGSTAGSTLNYHLIFIIIILVRELVLYHSQLVLSLLINPPKSIPYHVTVNLFIDKGPLHFLTTHVIGRNLGLFVLLEDQFSINRLALVVFRIPT